MTFVWGVSYNSITWEYKYINTQEIYSAVKFTALVEIEAASENFELLGVILH